MKKLLLVLGLFLICAGCSNQNDAIKVSTDNTIYTKEISVDKKIDSNGVIKQEYALELLSKKSSGNELCEEEKRYIDYYCMCDEKGIAVLDLHGIGMQKVIAQLYVSKDNGKTWKWAKEIWLSSGESNFEFDGDKLNVINYANVTEKTYRSYILFDDLS